MPTPKEECIDALLAAATRLDESPTKAQYEKLGLTPASGTIIRQLNGWNTAKEAAGLGTNPSTGSRVGPKPDDVVLSDECSWEELSVDQRWHYRNRKWNTERTLQRRYRNRKWVNEQKRAKGCGECGRSDPAYLDLHHREDAEKEMNVGTMVTFGYGRVALEAEMAKCEVLCANCHRKNHLESPSDDLRTWVYERKNTLGGCSECSEDNPICLDFHHETDEKSDTISSMIANGRPRRLIRKEIARCRVLCANCHRKHHYQPPSPPTGQKSG